MAVRRKSLKKTSMGIARQMRRQNQETFFRNKLISSFRSGDQLDIDTRDWIILAELLDKSRSIEITFNKFVDHIQEWTGNSVRQPAFEILPNFNFVDSIIKMIQQNTVFYTAKATYKLMKRSDK